MEPLRPAHRADRSAADRARRAQRAPASASACRGTTSRRSSRARSSAPRGRASWRASAPRAEVDPDLVEWNYGEYEGRSDHRDPRRAARTGSSSATAAPAANRRARSARGPTASSRASAAVRGDVLIFSSGHFLRVLAARWLGLEPAAGRFLLLGTASLSALGYEHGRAGARHPAVERYASRRRLTPPAPRREPHHR